ncbi:MAG: 50S ribosome-binding GTPase [Lachnospiraceae bacterium]|nr:50S ribosome-binding GTPase [Lachnospiraceae bacterium]
MNTENVPGNNFENNSEIIPDNAQDNIIDNNDKNSGSIDSVINPAKANIVVVGNSGVGKSTLINSVFQSEELARTGIGEATTRELKVYESRDLNFRLIDTMGFEPGFLNQNNAIKAIRKWSRESIKNNDEERQIHMIWYCIDGTSKKMFRKNIDMLAKATMIWKSVPIIVVITKSYSKPERDENVAMVYQAFQSHKKLWDNLKAVIPIVARTYKIDADNNINVIPDGLAELLSETEKHIPEGLAASVKDMADYDLQQKRIISHSVVGTSVLAGITVGLTPIPFADGTLLTPLEAGLIKGLSKIYKVEYDNNTELIQTIVNAGAAGVIGKTALSGLKAVPGINIAGEVLNAIVAGSVIAALGEGCIYIFEQIYLGNKTASDIEWVKKIMESKAAEGLSGQMGAIAADYAKKKADGKVSTKDMLGIILKNIRK